MHRYTTHALLAGLAFAIPMAHAADAPATQPAWTQLDFGPAREIPVQYSGRTMPLDTLARQVVWQITGRQSLQGYDPVGLLLAWTWQGQEWLDQPAVLVGAPDLQEKIGLPADQKRFGYKALLGNSKLTDIASGKSEQDNPALRQNAQQVQTRLEMLQQVFGGHALRVVPPLNDPHGAWSTLREATGLPPAAHNEIGTSLENLRAAFLAADRTAFPAASHDLRSALGKVHSPAWPDTSLISLEVKYNRIHPFQWGWVLTCLAMVVALIDLALPNRILKVATWALLLAGFAALSAGIVMRWVFSGHAPLATMYESLIFMGWGATAIGLVMAAVVRLKSALPIVAAVATTILIVADSTPLDSIASPLVPVLRNTMWLTYHVLTIMLAYSAFALTMGIGHVQAARLAYNGARTPADSLGRLLYNMTLVGCVFLTAGIIFGAIWANKSWGRYWGWDPKETWSLITLLGYMAVLHGRRIGWFGSFGLAIASIICFQLVVMTYYGVNFVLGQGLHSYGFSSGGQFWVGSYVAIEIAFMLWMWVRYTRAFPVQM